MAHGVEKVAATGRRVLGRHHGVAHVRAFLEAGLTRNQVAHLRRIGVLLRPRIGWYCDPALAETAVMAIRAGGVLGCRSAASTWGIVVPEGAHEVVHVSIEPGSSRLRRSTDAARRAPAGTDPDAQWHWEERADPATGWRISPIDAILQMASCVSLPWLVAAIDSARNGTTSPAVLLPDEVGRLRALLPAHLRQAVDVSDARAESSGETFIRLGLLAANIPFELQVWLTSKYRTDLFVDGWLPVESDGMKQHSGRQAVLADRSRDATIARLGAPPLRFSQAQAVRETDFVVDTIRAVWVRGRDRRDG